MDDAMAIECNTLIGCRKYNASHQGREIVILRERDTKYNNIKNYIEIEIRR